MLPDHLTDTDTYTDSDTDSDTRSDSDPDAFEQYPYKSNWCFTIIAKVHNCYYRLATTNRDLTYSEFLSSCLNARTILQANAYALRSERFSEELGKYALAFSFVMTYLPFTKTCLQVGLGFTNYKSYFSKYNSFIFDITDGTETRYAIIPYWNEIQPLDGYTKSLDVHAQSSRQELGRFDNWKFLSHEARCFLGYPGDANIDYLNQLVTESGTRTPHPVNQLNPDGSMLQDTKLHAINCAPWLRDIETFRSRHSHSPEQYFLRDLLVLALANAKHVDLSPYKLCDGDKIFIFKNLRHKIQSIDISREIGTYGIYGNYGLRSILTLHPEIKTVFMFNTPHISLDEKFCIMDGRDFYATELFKSGSNWPRTFHLTASLDAGLHGHPEWIEFIWWRMDKDPLICRLDYTLNTERIVKGVAYFVQNLSLGLSNLAAGDVFRYGLAGGTHPDYRVYPIQPWEETTTASYLEDGRRTIILVSTELGSSLIYAALDKSSNLDELVIDEMSDIMNRYLDHPRLVELERENISHAIEELDLVPPRVPGGFPSPV